VEKILTWLNHIPDDKTKHALGGVFLFAVGALTGTAIRSLIVGMLLGILLTLVVALLKENYDKGHPNHTADAYDVLWTLGGGLLGLCCLLPAYLH
jgi:hypothetical protein